MSLAINDRVQWSPGEPPGVVISKPYKKYGRMVVRLMTGGPFSREWPVAQCRKVGNDMMRVEFTGNKVTITDGETTVIVQITPLSDTETGAIVWRDGRVIGGLMREEGE